MEVWFEKALSYVIGRLQDSPRSDVTLYFSDFIEDNREKLFEGLAYEEIEEFAESHFNDFQDWVSGLDDAGVSIDRQGQWGLGEEPLNEDAGNFVGNEYLSNYELDLLDYDLNSCSLEMFDDFSDLLKKLVSKSDRMAAFKCAYRLALCAEKSETMPLSSKGDYWMQVATHAGEVLKIGGAEKKQDLQYKLVEFYCKSAGLYERDRQHSAAISSYKNGFALLESLSDYPESKVILRPGYGPLDSKKVEVLKAWRLQAQVVGEHDDASSLYVKEMHVVRSNSACLRRAGLSLYCWMSGYGESPWRVIGSIALCIFLFSFLVFMLSIEYKTPNGEGCLDFFDSIYYVVVTFTTLGYGEIYPVSGFGKFISNFLSFLGLFLSGMFVASIVRRYSRA